jgi:hypothetical protein
MLWGCFAAHGVGHLYRIREIMVKEMFRLILNHEMRASAAVLFSDGRYTFQQDNY